MLLDMTLTRMSIEPNLRLAYGILAVPELMARTPQRTLSSILEPAMGVFTNKSSSNSMRLYATRIISNVIARHPQLVSQLLEPLLNNHNLELAFEYTCAQMLCDDACGTAQELRWFLGNVLVASSSNPMLSDWFISSIIGTVANWDRSVCASEPVAME